MVVHINLHVAPENDPGNNTLVCNQSWNAIRDQNDLTVILTLMPLMEKISKNNNPKSAHKILTTGSKEPPRLMMKVLTSPSLHKTELHAVSDQKRDNAVCQSVKLIHKKRALYENNFVIHVVTDNRQTRHGEVFRNFLQNKFHPQNNSLTLVIHKLSIREKANKPQRSRGQWSVDHDAIIKQYWSKTVSFWYV